MRLISTMPTLPEKPPMHAPLPQHARRACHSISVFANRRTRRARMQWSASIGNPTLPWD
jgi:hypothetical protein